MTRTTPRVSELPSYRLMSAQGTTIFCRNEIRKGLSPEFHATRLWHRKTRGPLSADCKRGRRKGAASKRRKSSRSVKKFFDTFRQFSRRAKNVKNRQKVSKSFSTLFDNFRAAPFFRPLLQSAEKVSPLDLPGFCQSDVSFCRASRQSARNTWLPVIRA